MEDKQLFQELNKILTLEHAHLGMYKNFLKYSDKEIRRTFRRFMEVEMEHIAKINSIIYNLGGKPTLLAEGADILGSFFGFTINMVNEQSILTSYSLIEKKSHQGYAEFIHKVEQDSKERNQFIAEIVAPNMLEAKLMHLWLEDRLQRS